MYRVIAWVYLSVCWTCESLQLSTTSSDGTTSKFWLRRGGTQKIHYTQFEGARHKSSPVLLLNGFGVGFFHWERNFQQLAEESGSCVFAMDYLGQGNSWPVDADDGKSPSELGLRYSIDDWVEQSIEFIEKVVLEQSTEASTSSCILVGNSLGGLIATIIATKRPDLVSKLALLNPTPLWGGNLPGWDSRLPGPSFPRAIGRVMYDLIRDPKNIRSLLIKTYSDPNSIGLLPQQIRAVTDTSAGGHAAFASIMWARPASIPKKQGIDGETGNDNGDFYDALRQLSCPTLLLYGAEDPWCSPEFGRAAMRALCDRDSNDADTKSVYVELSPCGHCPHHEAPEATNSLISRWIRSEGPLRAIVSDKSEDGGEKFGRVTARNVDNFSSRSLWESALVSFLR